MRIWIRQNICLHVPQRSFLKRTIFDLKKLLILFCDNFINLLSFKTVFTRSDPDPVGSEPFPPDVDPFRRIRIRMDTKPGRRIRIHLFFYHPYLRLHSGTQQYPNNCPEIKKVLVVFKKEQLNLVLSKRFLEMYGNPPPPVP